MTKKEKDFKKAMEVRGLNFIKLGMMIEVNSKIGTIAGYNLSGNLDVVFSNQLKYGKHKHNCHPTWKTKYYADDGVLLAEYND